MKSILPILAALLALPAWAQTPAPQTAGPPPALGLPIACSPGRDCYIQNYVDADPGPGFKDHKCGRHGYDGDTGTDFRLPGFAAMRRGVAVVAAAPGVVRAVRDGEPDTGLPPEGEAKLAGKFAGNGVVLDHGGGWTTQYSHMRQGSIRVKPGERVTAGQPLGLVGYSGRTQFPHLELIVRQGDRIVDPFVGPAEGWTCGGPRKPLWSEQALAALPYEPTHILSAGFAPDRVDVNALREGAYDNPALPSSAERLILWADVMGLEQGDRVELRLRDAAGNVVARKDEEMDRDRAIQVVGVALPRPPGGWLPQRYVGIVRVVRGGGDVDVERREFEVGG
ncbi:MAG TPA: M23 family metallopeptidase [Azospirillaceae bacterium]|nr:M23 family metallopeptidase [Azospirillaceae bacterium]